MAEPGFQPIARSPLYEQVAQRLRDFISTQELQPGDRLMSERELAEQLGVSRTSVRQALTALRVMGVVEVRHGDGIFLQQPPDRLVSTLASEVAAAQPDDPMIWEVREGVEVQAARLAARRRTEEQLTGMGDALAAMSRSLVAGGDGIDGDRLFHRAIVAAAHNRLLESLVEQLADAMDRTSEASLTRAGRGPQSLEGHQEILAAIADRDEDAAARAMRAHIGASASVVTAQVPPSS